VKKKTRPRGGADFRRQIATTKTTAAQHGLIEQVVEPVLNNPSAPERVKRWLRRLRDADKDKGHEPQK
jgi:hypothetical protein